MPTLTSAREQYLIRQKLAVLGISLARRSWSNATVANLSTSIGLLQLRAAREADAGVSAMLLEQGIRDIPEYDTIPESLAGVSSDGRSLQGLLDQADSLPALEMMVSTQIADAARTQTGVAMAVRREVTVYVRTMTPPSCSRCAILAGRVYRWSQGFERHPHCDCINVPSTEERGRSMVTDPEEMFRKGQITDLSVADTQAVRDGADMAQVVNIRRKAAGLSTSGKAVARGGRLTPEGIYRLASDRTEALTLLRRFGYIK